MISHNNLRTDCKISFARNWIAVSALLRKIRSGSICFICRNCHFVERFYTEFAGIYNGIVLAAVCAECARTARAENFAAVHDKFAFRFDSGAFFGRSIVIPSIRSELVKASPDNSARNKHGFTVFRAYNRRTVCLTADISGIAGVGYIRILAVLRSGGNPLLFGAACFDFAVRHMDDKRTLVVYQVCRCTIVSHIYRVANPCIAENFSAALAVDYHKRCTRAYTYGGLSAAVALTLAKLNAELVPV